MFVQKIVFVKVLAKTDTVFRLLDSHRQTTSTISMSDWFHRPQVVEKGRNLEELTMSMLIQNLEETDNHLVDEVIELILS